MYGVMKEEFLQYIWANSLYRNDELVTYNGMPIRILDAGQLNRDAGPDFFNARIRMGEIILAGNVEIHLRSSDWYRHGHHLDAAYDNVILSVVKDHDIRIYNSEGTEVECIVLDYVESLYNEYLFMRNMLRHPGCYRRLDLLDDAWFYRTLQSLAIERLQRKVNDIRQMLEQTSGDWGECFYRLLCKYWSANVNSEIFYQLALHLPYRLLLRYADRLVSVEALLFGCAGLLENPLNDNYRIELKKEYVYLSKKHKLWTMPSDRWKFMRIRPEAFPTVRIALLAGLICRFGNLLSYILEATELETAIGLFNVRASAYWDTHYLFGTESSSRVKKLGRDAQKILFINAVVPFMFIYGTERGEDKFRERALRWLEKIEAEKNYIVRSWEKCGFVFESALQTQALIQLRKEYCDRHLCLRCRIGRQILSELKNERR